MPNLDKEIKDAKNRMMLEVKKTSLSKLAFIDEINHGLGDEIKEGAQILSKLRDETTVVEVIHKDGLFKRFFNKIFNIF